ncbi:Transposon Ty3-G Gag-Pol poly [Labeo rohita]|nr:Transposon Ty3-G Gag-Pol poly [Labeo rohita]
METNHKVEPVKLPKQRVPVAMMGPLKEELNNLQEQGKEMLLADALSRAYLEDSAQEGLAEKEIESVNMIQYLPVSEERLKEIDFLPDTKSSTVINKLKAHFARQGIPDIMFSDNGPQYMSTEFQQFSRLSSPAHPQSNGKVESAIKTAKRLMQKAKISGRDPYLVILDH